MPLSVEQKKNTHTHKNKTKNIILVFLMFVFLCFMHGVNMVCVCMDICIIWYFVMYVKVCGFFRVLGPGKV